MPPKQAPIIDPVPAIEPETEVVVEVFDSKWLTVKEDEYADICCCENADIESKFQGFIKIDIVGADNMRAQILEEYLLHAIMYNLIYSCGRSILEYLFILLFTL
jgi:hypothetical protein